MGNLVAKFLILYLSSATCQDYICHLGYVKCHTDQGFGRENFCLCIEIDSGIMTAVYEPTLHLVGTNIDA